MLITRALDGVRRRLTSAERLTRPSRSLGTSSFDWRISKAAASRPAFVAVVAAGFPPGARRCLHIWIAHSAHGSSRSRAVNGGRPQILPCEQLLTQPTRRRRVAERLLTSWQPAGCSSRPDGVAVRRPRLEPAEGLAGPDHDPGALRGIEPASVETSCGTGRLTQPLVELPVFAWRKIPEPRPGTTGRMLNSMTAKWR